MALTRCTSVTRPTPPNLLTPGQHRDCTFTILPTLKMGCDGDAIASVEGSFLILFGCAESGGAGCLSSSSPEGSSSSVSSRCVIIEIATSGWDLLWLSSSSSLSISRLTPVSCASSNDIILESPFNRTVSSFLPSTPLSLPSLSFSISSTKHSPSTPSSLFSRLRRTAARTNALSLHSTTFLCSPLSILFSNAPTQALLTNTPS
mmetsp:Transcript_32348/g.39759  ORF Transcript_32348/g.39759 Transcript_32348/m.39759 type:complete len:204 (+) Transcript_32348:1332-1943(+)